ncbi:MAG TPA: CGNR zinc finger domain-containing protein [Streptosporangiaceae bacterium]|nr:CGNR zinc finger domain-containing protein [Streptosporangiaceae bacterium]
MTTSGGAGPMAGAGPGGAGEDFLLALLNTTPVVDGVPTDELADPARGRSWLAGRGGGGSEAERERVRAARDMLQAVVRGDRPADDLAPFLNDAVAVPAIDGGQVSWALQAAPDRRLAAAAVLAWDQLARRRPGRLRPCANDTCHLFLIDRTKGNTARWCSMAACGNRLKARRHYQRSRTSD